MLWSYHKWIMIFAVIEEYIGSNPIGHPIFLLPTEETMLESILLGSKRKLDTSPIDLLKTKLDPRIKFSCPSSHAYWAANGYIYFANPNTYPLEYKDGLPIGRHEPEKESTNYFWNSAVASSIPSSVAGSGSTITRNLEDTFGEISTVGYQVVTTAVNLTSFASFSSRHTDIFPSGTTFVNSFLCYAQNISTDTVSYNSGNTNDTEQISISTTPQFFTKKETLATTRVPNLVIGNMMIAKTRNIVFGANQIELGEIRTSPILTGAESATRQKATVFVAKQKAFGIQVYYSNGKMDVYYFDKSDTEDYYELPTCELDWGTRYIQRIEYIIKDTSPIDFLAEDLDNRVEYLCDSSHAFFGIDSKIHYAQANSYPLEYRDGMAVGRHEPEPQATNIISVDINNPIWNYGQNGLTFEDSLDGILEGYPTARTWTTHATSSRACTAATTQTGKVTVSMIVKKESDVQPLVRFYYPDQLVDLRATLDVNTQKFTSSPEVMTYVSDLGEWLFAVASVDQSGFFNSYIYPNFAGTEGAFATLCGGQIETGTLSTSPVNSSSTKAIRAQSFVNIEKQGAYGVRVYYTDATVEDQYFDNDGNTKHQLLNCRYNWGTRYIYKIEYILNNTSSIDFKETTLDSRIQYLNAGRHAYFGSDGLIHYAAPNEWPLEYRNGEPVGRHEPEPQRTNYVKNSMMASASNWHAYQSTFTQGAVTAPDGSKTALITNSSAGAGHGVYQLSNIPTPGDTFPITASCFAKTSSSCQLYLERSGVPARLFLANEEWQYGTQHVDGKSITTPYLGTLVFYSTPDSAAGDSYSAWAVQVEIGECSTSPIATTSAIATRANAIAGVQRQGASGIRVIYDVGDPDIHVFPDDGDSVFYLPYAKYDWGYRLITEIQYITADIRPIDLTAPEMD